MNRQDCLFHIQKESSDRLDSSGGLCDSESVNAVGWRVEFLILKFIGPFFGNFRRSKKG